MNGRKPSVILLALTALLIAGTMSAAAAPGAQESGARTAVFGEVVGVDAGVLTVRTKDGDVDVALTDETKVRGRGGDEEGSDEIAVGDRVAIVAVEGTAQSILVKSAERRQRNRVVHVSGVVSEITEDGAVFVSEDGTERKVAFGLNAAPPEPGTVVTLTGRVDADTGTLQVRSVHPLRKTIERLNGHVDELDQATTERSDRLRRLRRVQELLERNSGRQVQLLTRVAEKLPAEARAGLARAIEGLEQADRGAARAFERALKLAGEAERERRNVDDLPERRLPGDAKPSFEDLAAVLGMSEDELAELLKAGETLAAIVERLGMTLGELHDGIVARIEVRLGALVEAGELTEEALGLVLDQVRDRIAGRIRSLFHDSPIHDELPFSVEDLATVFGFGPEGTFAVETFARLREGATPFDLGEERGISRDELIEKLRAIAEKRARSLVEEGALTEEDLERFIERFMGNLEDRLSEAKGRRGPDRGEDEARKKEREREADARNVPFDLKVLAELFGTDVRSVRELLVSGSTLAEIAAQHDATVEEAADRLLEEMKRKLGRQIEAGRITDKEASDLLDRARSSFIERLRGFRLEAKEEREKRDAARDARRIDRPYSGVPLTVAEIADAIGIPVEELRELMAERGGIEKLLEARGVRAEDVVAKLLSLVEPRLRTSANASDPRDERAGRQISDLERRLLEDLGGRRHRVEPTRRSVDTAAAKAVLGFIPFGLRVVADALGIPPQRLRELLRERTVAELAERADVPLRAIVDALMEPLEKRARAAAADGTPGERLREKLAAARQDFLRALRQFKLPEGEVRRELKERDARRLDRPAEPETPPGTSDEARPRPISPPTATPAPTATPRTDEPAVSAIRVSITREVASACDLKTREWDVSVADEWRTLRRALIACQNDLLTSLNRGLADVNKRAAAIRAEERDSAVADNGSRAGLAPADTESEDTADRAPAEDEVSAELLDGLASGLSGHATIVDVPVTTDAEARAVRLTGRFEALSARIAELDRSLSAIVEDAQLANVELQDVLQRQQQTLQMLSNISKLLHDTAMSIIRKIGG